MSRQSRKVRKLIQSLAEVIDAAHYQDSYGVHGSEFSACSVCGSSDRPGIFHDPEWHRSSCPVAKAAKAHEADINRYWRTQLGR